MAITERVTWTALPNGVNPANGKLRMSILISPRLSTTTGLPRPALSQFADFVVWPKTPVSFKVELGTLVKPITSDATEVPPPAPAGGPAPDPAALWAAVLPPTTFVRPHEVQDLTSTRIHSYPVAMVRDFVRDSWVKFATLAPSVHPELGDFVDTIADGSTETTIAGRFGDFVDAITLPTKRDVALQVLADAWDTRSGRIAPRQFIGKAGVVDHAHLLLAAQAFHTREVYKKLVAAGPPSSTVPAPILASGDVDFHQVVSSAGDYPFVLRHLRLLRDVEFSLPAGFVPGATTVRVVPVWSPVAPAPVDYTPLTSCQVSSTQFFTRTATTTTLADGMLKLEDPRYDLVEVDPDGAVFATLQFHANLTRFQDPFTTAVPIQRAVPTDAAVPALHTAGLSINETDRSGLVFAKVEAASTMETDLATPGHGGKDTTLTLDHLTRGFRIDVFDSTSGLWHPLCARRGTYEFLRTGQVLTFDDEGAVTLSAAGPAIDPKNPKSDDLFLHESIMRWTGWSLVAPRPGKAIVTTSDANNDPSNSIGDPNMTPSPDYKFRATFHAAPGTLPRLRFGRSYKARARVVDLAGNGIDLRTANMFGTTHATRAVTFGRFEPVPSPAVLLRFPRTPGESVELMAIRSNYNTPAGAPSERHVAPPKTAELVAEEHGAFDVPGGFDPNAYAVIARKDPGSFSNGGTPDPNFPDQSYFPTDELVLPYLPDVPARGVALRGLPGVPAGRIVKVPFSRRGRAWPHAVPFRLRIVEGTGPPTLHANPGLLGLLGPVGSLIAGVIALLPLPTEEAMLVVQVPKGVTTTIAYSCYLDETDLRSFGLWNWLAASATPAATLDALKAMARDGQHYMLTPYRSLTLSHAVRQPLLVPAFAHLVSNRGAGETFASLEDMVTFSRKSTSKLDLQAAWTEPIDIVANPLSQSRPPTTVSRSTLVAELKTDVVSTDGDSEAVIVRHDFGDTKHRDVHYSMVATSRYTEFFQEQTDITMHGTRPTTITSLGIVPGTDRVSVGTVSPTVFTRDIDYTEVAAQGTIARTANSAIPDGSRVHVQFVANPVSRTGPEKVLDIVSTARPAAAVVHSVIPSWGWQSTRTDALISSTRQGNGLRVYLHRPWWSSGEAEQLGVVIWPDQTEPPDNLKPLVTRWGQDPIWASQATKAPNPSLADFAVATTTGTGLKTVEIPGPPVSVAGHDVHYDPVRQLWYADVVLTPGVAYYPFVRLALARYQKHSLLGVELSPITLADFVQLTPDRSATVTVDPHNRRHLTVTVTGPTYTSQSDGPQESKVSGPSTMTLSLQAQDPALDPDLAWGPATPPLELTLTAAAATRNVFSWTGSIMLPKVISRNLRLVIREYESFHTVTPGTATIAAARPNRMVYTDIIPLDTPWLQIHVGIDLGL